MTRTREHARKRCTPLALGLGLSMILGLGCGTGDGHEAEKTEQSPDSGSLSSGVEAAADPLVSYDLRRLRPREDEPLAKMFERVRVQAIEEHKRVAVLFSADWCEPCRHLDLELGNAHPATMIGDVRILELKEDDWSVGARMDEYNALRRRWEPVLNTYPLLLLLDAEGKRVEEMKDAKLRLEAAGLEPTLPMWFEETAS